MASLKNKISTLLEDSEIEDIYKLRGFSLNTGPISEDTKEIARIELRETPENVKKGLQELKALLENDPEIYFESSDDFLLIYLRACKFYAESAYSLMKRVAEFKKKHAIMQNLMPKDVVHIFLKYNLVGFLEQRDHKGRRVLLENMGMPWDPSKVSNDELLKIVYLITELAAIEPETQVRGGVVIMDYYGLTMKHVLAFTPSLCGRLMELIQEALPMRLKEVHVVRQPPYFKAIWTLMKPFVGEKMKKRLFFHGYKMSSLHKFIPPSHLPKDYGGDLPPLKPQGEVWARLFEEHIDHMKKMNKCGYINKI